MVDDHRRVEPRSIIGTGMATDPDRIREIDADQARRERSGDGPPKRSFATVLEEEPQQPREDPSFELEDAQEEATVKVSLNDDQTDEAEDKENETPFGLEEEALGETISSAALHQKLMRFKR